MYTGVVKFFDSAPSKQFGFIQHNGSEIFFHSSSSGMMACLGGETPVFVPCQQMRVPKKGDSLLFESERGDRGYRATKWCFPETLQTALEQIAARPEYQLIERRGFIMYTRLHNDAKAKYFPLWQGKNLDDLRAKFPQDKFPVQEDEQFARYFKVVSADGTISDFNGDPR